MPNCLLCQSFFALFLGLSEFGDNPSLWQRNQSWKQARSMPENLGDDPSTKNNLLHEAQPPPADSVLEGAMKQAIGHSSWQVGPGFSADIHQQIDPWGAMLSPSMCLANRRRCRIDLIDRCECLDYSRGKPRNAWATQIYLTCIVTWPRHLNLGPGSRTTRTWATRQAWVRVKRDLAA